LVRLGDADQLGRGEEVHLQHLPDDLGRRGAELAEAAHTGAVDQHVQTAEPLDRARDDPLAVFGLRQVAGERLGLRAGGLALRDDLREVFLRARRQGEPCAQLREPLGRTPPDPARRAGHQDHSPAQIPPHHRHHSSSGRRRQNSPIR